MSIAAPTWQFVPKTLDAGKLTDLEPLFSRLQSRKLSTATELEAWLRDESELLSRISAEIAHRYIRMTCCTEDTTAKDSFLSMEREISPRVKVLADRLDKKLLECPVLDQLDQKDQDRYQVLLRQRRAAKEIFRPENTELQVQESELQTKQKALMGSLSVEFEGREHTMQQMAPYYEEQDRQRRRAAYLAVLDVRRPTWEPLEEIFDQLVGLRHQMAQNAGFEHYTEYRFKELQRFDYDPELCMEFHNSVEQVVVPAVQRLNHKRRQDLGLATLAPFDLQVDLTGQAPLTPFKTEPELIHLAKSIFSQVDPRFAGEFQILEQHKLLDLMSRKGKAPGGYQYTLEDQRLPFIFCNAVGTHQDVQTLLHEGGHAFHAILSRNDPLLAYRESPIEFAETASMSMELMGLENIHQVYDQETAQRAKHKHLEGLLRIFPWIASIDAFQHWVYANPKHSRKQRRAQWLAIMDRFEPDLDYGDFPEARDYRWTSQGHLFGQPFYYIEYGIAQIAALQVWQNYRRDPKGAVEAYRQGLSLGGKKPLPELFAATGVKFDVSKAMLEGLVADIEQQIHSC